MDRGTYIALVVTLVPALVSGVITSWTLVVTQRQRERDKQAMRLLEEINESQTAITALNRAYQSMMSRNLAGSNRALDRAGNAVVQWHMLGKELVLEWWRLEEELNAFVLSSHTYDHDLARRRDGVHDRCSRTLDEKRRLVDRGKLRQVRASSPSLREDPEVERAFSARRERQLELNAAARERTMSEHPWPEDSPN